MHLLGLDHEINDEAEAEMEKEEELVLKSLGWKGKGLIKSAHDAANDSKLHAESSDGRSLLMLIVLLPVYLHPTFSSISKLALRCEIL